MGNKRKNKGIFIAAVALVIAGTFAFFSDSISFRYKGEVPDLAVHLEETEEGVSNSNYDGSTEIIYPNQNESGFGNKVEIKTDNLLLSPGDLYIRSYSVLPGNKTNEFKFDKVVITNKSEGYTSSNEVNGYEDALTFAQNDLEREPEISDHLNPEADDGIMNFIFLVDEEYNDYTSVKLNSNGTAVIDSPEVIERMKTGEINLIQFTYFTSNGTSQDKSFSSNYTVEFAMGGGN